MPTRRSRKKVAVGYISHIFKDFFILFKTLKLLQTMNIYINTIRNNLRVTKTKMCVARYTNKIWAQNVFSAIKSYYINNNIMKTIKSY